jgi:membrane associated rhomboid family serine protease
MISLYQDLSGKQAEMCALILAASNIECRVQKRKSGFQVNVRSKDFASALTVMSLYFQENPEAETIAPPAEIRESDYSGIPAAVLLAVFYLAVGEDRHVFFKKFGSSASHILNGEIYRTVTSLMLHLDTVHLVGNMAAIALFGSTVCRIRGMGVGWLMIVLTGAIGNFCNAALYHSDHLAVGASTAVFGAIGILSAHQFWNKMTFPGQGVKAWLPLAGGLALLGILGSGGGRVDLMAHLFGFSAGLLLETLYRFGVRTKPIRTIQVLSLLSVAGIIALSWLWPEI